MQMSTDSLSRLSHSLKIDREHQHFPVTAEDSIDISQRTIGNLAMLFCRCKSLLDILEPLHWRRAPVRSSDSVSLWSYSFSIVRWKNSICLFQPDLQGALDFYENYHRYMHTFFLEGLDDFLSSGDYSVAAMLLNVWYEGISAMKDTPSVNISAKEHLLSSLTHHLLHVYRILLPIAPKKSRRKTDVETLALSCNMFPQTLKLLPASWQILRRGRLMRSILRFYRKPSMSQENVEVRPGTASSRDSRQQVEFPAPLKTYFPPGFLDLFCVNTEEQHYFEVSMQEDVSHLPPFLQEEVLGLFPWIIGVGLGLFSSLNDAEDTSEVVKLSILYLIKQSSLYAWDKAMEFHSRSRERNGLTVSDLMANRHIVEAWMIESIEPIRETLVPCQCSLRR